MGIQSETDKFLHLTVATDQRHETDIECSLFASHAHILSHLGHRGQRCRRQPLIAGNVSGRHINKLRIFYCDCIDRICKAWTQFLLIVKDRKQRVNTNLFGRQVEEALRHHAHALSHDDDANKEP